MATCLVVIAFSIGFFELFLLLRVNAVAASIVALSRESARTLRSGEIEDEEAERITRRISTEIAKATWRLALRFLLIAAVLYVPFLLLDRHFPWLTQEMRRSIASPAVIAISTFGVTCYALARRAILRRA